MLSILLPLIRVNILGYFNGQGSVAKVIYTMTLQDEIVIEPGKSSIYSTNFLLAAGYILVSLFFIANLILTLIKIRRLRRNNQRTEVKGIQFINTNASGTPFSFFNSIFWNRKIDLNSVSGQQILDHEIAHIREKHTYDKLFINVVLLFYWINPFFWLIRKELNMIHEFVADKVAMEDADVNAFAEMILASIYPQKQFSITNNFFYSPIKRRLLMLTKNKNSKVNYTSRLLALPLAVFIFIAVSGKVKASIENDYVPASLTTGNVPFSHKDLKSDTIPAIYYNNKKVASVTVTKPDGKKSMVVVTYVDGSKEITTMDETKKRELKLSPQVETVDIRTVTGSQSANVNENEEVVFTKLEQEAEFPGGASEWSKYITMQINKDIDAIAKEGKYGTAIIRFIVDKNGKVSDVEATTMKGTLLAKIAIDAIRKGPKWIPGEQNGRVVNSYRLQPVTLKDAGKQVTELKNYPEEIFTKLEQEAQFPGGASEWNTYIAMQINKDIDAIAEEGKYGTATIRFIVDKNGKVSNVEATTMKGTLLAKTAVDAIRKGPSWIPGEQKGRVVNSYRLQPVTLKDPRN
jgi:outer membrane biosynthesis protein TonB